MTPHPVVPKARVSDATGTARQTTHSFGMKVGEYEGCPVVSKARLRHDNRVVEWEPYSRSDWSREQTAPLESAPVGS